MLVRGIRGATTTAENSAAEIYTATRELLDRMIMENDIEAENVVSIMLTMTPDLNADFPAKAVRSHPDWQWVPLMCSVEVNVPQSLKKCIRLLLHVNTDKKQQDMVHVYLREAIRLRPDLAGEDNA
ncbi:chorismate mutase [Alicyclobacillus sp. SO9]|nr:chorismate mutase [Alicyclobacillus sp. SO9]QQE81269.1 chorismate mutase [Alicyclobacillus sp. SO9]